MDRSKEELGNVAVVAPIIHQVVAPVIHQDGTHPNELMEALGGLRVALAEAQDALRRCSPNERDYQGEPGRFTRAYEQHCHRRSMLGSLDAEVEAEMRAILDQKF